MDDGVEAYFDKQSGKPRAIAMALRDLLVAGWPSLSVGLAWGFPCWSGNERVLSVIAHKERCNLQLFYGAALAQEFPNRIEGTGKALRHVKVHDVSEIDDELTAIIERAVKLDRIDPQKVR